MNCSIIKNQNVSYLDSILLENNLLKVVSASILSSISPMHLPLFGHLKGFYCFPTIELADWLKKRIDLASTIEIGAGHGSLARHLGIPATDSRYMEDPEIQLYFSTLGQPVTVYPNDVIKMNYMEAIRHYNPKTVIGCWITHKFDKKHPECEGNMFGIDEQWILDNVETYIMIGNEKVHFKKPILHHPHETYKFSWLFSRSQYPEKNIIYVWRNSKKEEKDGT